MRLSVDWIIITIEVTKSEIATWIGAARVLIEYLINRELVGQQQQQQQWNGLNTEIVVLLIKSLITGEKCMTECQITGLVDRIKASRLPSNIRRTIAGKC